MIKLADLFEALTGIRPEWASLVITEAAIDSRQVIPGALFIALPGENADGHDYVPNAFENGAGLALIQRDLPGSFPQFDLRSPSACEPVLLAPQPPFDLTQHFCLRVDDALAALQTIARFWRRKVDVRVIGITGSVGKSTTKELVADVLGQRYRTLKNPGNFNNEIGLPLTLLSLSEGHERAVLEMGFYVPGEIAFLCDLALPSVGIVTNIGTVHAERAGSIEAIAQGKAELVQALPVDGTAILNYDDPLVLAMAGKTRAQVFTYGLDARADLWADDVDSLGLEGIRFQIHFRGEGLYLRVPLLGRHSVHTALRAAAAGIVEGLTWEEILTGLKMGTTQLRLVAVRAENGALILDDTYNASPQSTLAALNLLEELEGNRIAVLGDMLELGPYEKEGHELVGGRAAEIVSSLVCVGSRAATIAEAARQAGMPAEAVFHFDQTEDAAAFLSARLTARDVVLIKGSHGMRMDRIVTLLEAGR